MNKDQYTFSSDISQERVEIIVYDDMFLEDEEQLSLCILLRNTDVQLVSSTSPSCIRVRIQDNEGKHIILK